MSVFQRRLWNQLQIATSGVAFTQVNTNILAAPGAGFRYRIFGVSIGRIGTSMAAAGLPANITVAFFAANPVNAGAVFMQLDISNANAGGKSTDHETFGDIGWVAATNAAVIMQHASDLATMQFRASITYALERSV
jgi:hypothetical protein